MLRKERVTKVIDGDTFETASRKNAVRLAGVDAPEVGQSGASSAKKFLEGLILDQIVTIDTRARDKHRRSVANVKVGKRSVNRVLRERLKKR